MDARAEEIVSLYTPGNYLLKGSSEEVARSYLKMEKEKWLLLVKHDYVLALVKRDLEAASKLEKAYNAVRTMFDWQEDMLKEVGEKMSQRPSEAAEEAVKALFKLYAKEVQENTHLEVFGFKLALGSWRAKPDETVKDGSDRGLDYEADIKGELFRTEWRLWFAITRKLSGISREARVKRDRVTCWFARKLYSTIDAYLFGAREGYEKIVDPYIETAIEDSLAGREADYWKATEQYHLNLASYYLKYSEGKHPGMYLDYDLGAAREAVKCIIKALMAKLQVEPGSIPEGEFMKYVTEKLGIPTLMGLYEEAVRPLFDIKHEIETMFEEPSEERKAAEKEQVRKCKFFVNVMKHVFFTRPEERKFTITIDGKNF